MQPQEELTLNLLYYNFTIDQPASLGITSDDWGDEINFTVDWQVNDNLYVMGVLAALFPGTGAEQWVGGDKNWLHSDAVRDVFLVTAHVLGIREPIPGGSPRSRVSGVTHMSFNLRNRSLLTVQDYTQREFRYLLDLARDLRRAKYARTEQKHLEGKEICLIFEKTSTRTRCAFEVACYDQGANVTYLDLAGSQIGHKESFKDTARVLGRMYDAIEYRGASQTGVETLAKFAGVPVYNGLTDEYHPTQMIADIMTMREHSDKPVSQIKYAYIGDTRSNMGHSLMIAGCLMGMDVRICVPNRCGRRRSTRRSRAASRHSTARS